MALSTVSLRHVGIFCLVVNAVCTLVYSVMSQPDRSHAGRADFPIRLKPLPHNGSSQSATRTSAGTDR